MRQTVPKKSRGEMREALDPLVHRLDLEQQLRAWRPLAWKAELQGAPALHIDDFSAIPFLVDISGVDEYQHRARLRCTAGDLYAAVTPQTPGYEAYCSNRLGLSAVDFVRTERDGTLDLARLCGAGAAFDVLVDRARTAGRLLVHPFMGIEAVWHLAHTLGEAAEVPTAVLAPPPPVTWIANDKALFGELVERVLDRSFVVESRLANSVSSLAQALRELAARAERVALKRLRCASAMGNAVFDATYVRQQDVVTIETEVQDFLARTEWPDGESVQAVVWENAGVSPSTQLWIPPAGCGEPRLDGIYEQILAGERKVFVGSRPSTLPSAVERSLADASLVVAGALQVLGYHGRCSFDLLVIGDIDGDFAIRFTECNGRWGGTSTPMALLDRLLHGPRPAYRAQDFVHPGLAGARFVDLLAAVGNRAWGSSNPGGSFVFYNTGPLEKHGKLDVIALGSSRSEADRAVEVDLPRLWGL